MVILGKKKYENLKQKVSQLESKCNALSTANKFLTEKIGTLEEKVTNLDNKIGTYYSGLEDDKQKRETMYREWLFGEEKSLQKENK